MNGIQNFPVCAADINFYTVAEKMEFPVAVVVKRISPDKFDFSDAENALLSIQCFIAAAKSCPIGV